MAMIFTDPTKIVFETDMDIVNYVSGGTNLPRRKNFEMLMDALHDKATGVPTAEIVQAGNGNTVTINIENVPDPELLEKYMKQVYENRQMDRIGHIANIIVTAVTALMIGKAIGIHSANKEYESMIAGRNDGRHCLCVGDEIVGGDIPEI